MIILDTPVISAFMQEQPETAVIEWLDRQSDHMIWTTTISLYEIQVGLSLLPNRARRQRLDLAFSNAVDRLFRNRIFPLDHDAALRAGELAAERKLRGLNIGVPDTLIAGIALARGATILTRNVKDFRDLGVPAINPWHSTS